MQRVCCCEACSVRAKETAELARPARRRPQPPSLGSTPCPTRAEHACRGSIPIIVARVHTRPPRERSPDFFCVHAVGPRYSSAATVIAARFIARKVVHRQRDVKLSARPGGGTKRAVAAGYCNHALRAGRYRTRQKNVTHQGSPPGLSDDLVTPGWAKRASEPPSVCRVSGVQTRSRCDRDPTWRCHWCGRRCSPFVRYEFLRGRTCSIRRQTSARRRP